MPYITKQEQRGTTQVASHASGVLHAIASNMLQTALQQAAPSGIRTVGNGDAAGMIARLAQAGVRGEGIRQMLPLISAYIRHYE
jgi:hypothetical protein